MTIILDDAVQPRLVIAEDNAGGNVISFRPFNFYRDEAETMRVEIDNPRSGTGRSAHVAVSRADAARLAKFLAAWASDERPSTRGFGEIGATAHNE